MDLVVKKPDFVKMRRAAQRAKRKAMFGMANYLRNGARYNFARPSKKTSRPRGKPVQHVDSKFSAKNIRFTVSSNYDYAIVGSVKLVKNRKDVRQTKTASGILEHGGRVRFIEGQYRLPSGKKTWRRVSKKQTGKLLRKRSRTVNIAKRPFMKPALMKSIASGKIMIPWRGSFGGSS